MERELLHNSIQCPDGTILVSRHRHDFVEHKQKDGKEYFLDGGIDYQRIGFSDSNFKNLSIYSDDDHYVIREYFSWGRNFDEEGKPLAKTEYIKLKDVTDSHLDNILKFTIQSEKILKVLLDEKEFRKELLKYETPML